MRVSHKWICEIAGLSAQPEELAERLTFAGLEVEGLTELGVGFEKIIVAEIKNKKPHPKKDSLCVVEVDSGSALHQVVCGAPNCPGPGGRVVLAMPGAKIGSAHIESRPLLGVPSEGMLCSEEELGIGPNGDGILVLGEDTSARIGVPLVEALDLRDYILDISVTPNRPDALSHRGVARDAALLLGGTLEPRTLTEFGARGRPIGELVTVEIAEAQGCPRYSAAVVCGVAVRPSRFALRYRLHCLGIRPLSNIVDMTNLLLLEFGQPLHAFDLGRLESRRIVVSRAEQGERIRTLDGQERVLCDSDLLIRDGARPVAIAGVMGGLDSGVDESTKDIFIECAYFSPTWVRRTAKRLKLGSESSYRFERGVDPNQGPVVLEAALADTLSIAGGQAASGTIDCYPRPIEPVKVRLRPARFKQLMGYDVPAKAMSNILTGLGAKVSNSPDDMLKVTVPTSRPDIEREIDLIEEVARIRGLEEVPSTLPRIRCSIPHRETFEAARRTKELLVRLGLDESVSYSFVPEGQLEMFGSAREIVRIANPLSVERAAMRTSLLPGLLENARRAVSRFLPGLRQFEVATTFHDRGGELPEEVLRVAGLMVGPAPGCFFGEAPRSCDFYDVKGVAATLVLEASGDALQLESCEDVSWLHPRRGAAIRLRERVIGHLGELHPGLLSREKLPRGAVAFELEVLPLWQNRARGRAVSLPELPGMVRDVAFLVDDGVDAGPVVQALSAACGELAESVRLFDVYTGAGIAPGKKSLAVSVLYRAADRTLTDEEVDKVHGPAVAAVAAQFGAQQR